jgi:endonuclease/exonuclease/phosphatase family metal-dependent hydrolase
MPFSLATFNVKDLFDPEPKKLANLAALLERMDADVVGLQEVGSEAALEALVQRVPSLGYAERVIGPPDKRGIRNALLSRLPIARARLHTAEALEFPRFVVGDAPPFGARVPLRRGVVQARVVAPGAGEVDVFVAHFKSGRAVPMLDPTGAPLAPESDRERGEGLLRALVARSAEALFVRGLADFALKSDLRAKIAVVGDLNDTAGSLPVRIVAGLDVGAPTYLASCAGIVAPNARGSIVHEGVREQIDHVLASPALFARLTAARFLNEELRDHTKIPPDALPTADSDHAPFVVWFG